MEPVKEIEFKILSRVAEKGKLTEKELKSVLSDSVIGYHLVLSRIINSLTASITKSTYEENTVHNCYYQISEFGESRRQALEKEKNEEHAAGIIKAGLAKHAGIVRNGTKFLLIISILTLLFALYLIHLESISRHLGNLN